jgi:hypothetical protein
MCPTVGNAQANIISPVRTLPKVENHLKPEHFVKCERSIEIRYIYIDVKD